MSLKAYRLLRNNKEQGPFTAEELIEKNLKPYDLIWVDGRSAAWSYPGELVEFKTYAPLPNEEISVAQITKQQNIIPVSASVQAAVAMNDTISASKQKPRYKVSAAWSKIQTTVPAYKAPMINEAQKEALKKNNVKQADVINSKSLSWKDAWLDWEKEKTSSAPIELPEKTKPVVSHKKKNINNNYTVPALETKYSQPLDSLQDKYIDNILQQKQRSKKSFSLGKAQEFIIPTVALIVIFSISYWLMHGNNETAAALSAASPKTIQTPAPANTNEIASNTNNIVNTTPTTTNNTDEVKQEVAQKENTAKAYDQAEDRKPAEQVSKNDTKKNNIVSKQINDNTAAVKLPGTKTTQQPASDKPAKQFHPATINNVPANNSISTASNTNDLNNNESRPVRRRTYNLDEPAANQSAPINQPVVKKPVVRKTSESYVNVPEYTEMNNGSANLKIQNISNVNLDLVVVDVQYYDASNHFRKGETLYVHNLRAGKNIVVKTPRDVNSMYATSKVSLVSSDANNVNVIGDN